MTTNISFTPSSFYDFNTSSSSSQISSPFTEHSYELQPQQTQNLKSLLIILDSRKNFKELIGLLDGWTAFQKMLTIDHLHSTIWRMEQEIQKQKSKATMLFNDVLTMKKSRWLQVHFWKNHSERTWQISPEPLPIPPPLPSPPPVAIPGTPENPIDIHMGTRESPIKIKDDPEPVTRDHDDTSDEEFPFWGWVSPSIINDWEGRINWGAVKQCGNCGSVGHSAQWCRKGLTYDPDMGFWYTNKSGEIWLSTGAVLWTCTGYILPTYSFLWHARVACLLTFSFWHAWIAWRFMLTDAAPWWLHSSTYSTVFINCTQLIGSLTVVSQPCDVQPLSTFLLFKP